LTAGDRESRAELSRAERAGPLDSHANKSRSRDKDPGNVRARARALLLARVRVNFRLGRKERKLPFEYPPLMPSTL